MKRSTEIGLSMLLRAVGGILLIAGILAFAAAWALSLGKAP